MAMRQGRPKSVTLSKNSFDSFPSMNPMQRDIAMLNETFITQSHHILLLTLEEAQEITNELLGRMDDFFSFVAGPGNIKDGVDGFHFLSRLTTYYSPAGQLIMNFSALNIKAIEYKINGQSYIKITSYPGLRRILQGTRYGARNVQLLEMAIGRLGMSRAIVEGIKCCIYFSLAWRTIELIFKSDYLLSDFLVDVPMDMVKIIISGVVIEAVGGMLMLVSSAIVIGPLTILLIGLAANIALNSLDKEFHLSDYLKETLHKALIDQQRISAWNLQYSAPSFNHPYGTSW